MTLRDGQFHVEASHSEKFFQNGAAIDKGSILSEIEGVGSAAAFQKTRSGKAKAVVYYDVSRSFSNVQKNELIASFMTAHATVYRRKISDG